MGKTDSCRCSVWLRLVRLYAWWVAVFALQKPLFMLWYGGMFSGKGLRGVASVVWHGLPLDLSVAGYLCFVPAVALLAGVWSCGRVSSVLCRLSRFWVALSAVAVALTFVLNAVLYDYWLFPLDSTPFFYFFSSPGDAFASADVATMVLGGLLLCALSVGLYAGGWLASGLRRRHFSGVGSSLGCRLGSTLCGVFMLLLLFLAARGGITVSSMNTGRAYFSDEAAMNHAAVNPLLSLMESVAHEQDFGRQYRMMTDEEAAALFAGLTERGEGPSQQLLSSDVQPDVYLIILESFSSKLMSELGGRPDVAVCLDSLAREGVVFTRFHANSFRTDRGLVAILSGYPAQPTMSLMKYPRKTASLPSLARSMRQAGYGASYYYGGDADFTNMRSFLVSQGYERIVSDADFAVKDRLSKWGVPDHLVFERLLQDLESDSGVAPMLRVVQTSSSHEPFDVPFQRLDDERLNAFAYTDDCVGRFVRRLKGSDRWERSVVVLVADHLGAWPKGISNFDFSRYEIPLIMVGGAVERPCRVDTIGSQQDLAATLLGQLGIDHSDFSFSKDMLDGSIRHFAFFTVPDAFGLVDSKGGVIYDNKSGRVVASEGNAGERERLVRQGKAYLQKLYDDISAR